MIYNKLGKTGLNVSRLGLGCMRLPLLPAPEGQEQSQLNVDEKATIDLIELAIDKGITYIDTAYVYHGGISETLVGKALTQLKAHDKVTLATKLPPWELKTEADCERIFQEQCAKLQTECIDVLLLHNINGLTLPMFENAKALEFVQRLKKEGRIKHFGFSFHDELDFFDKTLALHDWEFCQIQYNFIDENYQAGLAGLKKAAARDMGVIIMEPLKGGALARTQPEDVEALWDNVTPKRTPADRALRWIFNQPEVSLVLSGMNTSEQLLENINSASHEPLSMPEKELALYAKACDIYQTKTKTPCTSCSYCMPCPNGVNIPGIFTLYNHTHLFNTGNYSKFVYNDIFKAHNSQATQCVECGICLEHCPQGINIPEELKAAHAELINTTEA